MDAVSEGRRLEGIRALRALEGDLSPALNRVVRLAAALTGAPSAAIHVLDAELQHRIAAVNAPLDTSPRKTSMCRLVVDHGEAVAAVDASTEARFEYASGTSGRTPVRFFAATPLQTATYGPLGTLCVWDTEPHADAGATMDLLADLAAIVIDALEAGRTLRLLAEAAATDELTDLPNRRLLYDTINRELARRDRHEAEVAVAYIDLDGFKAINDCHGHGVGDLVLAEAARRLRLAVRADEMVGRLGGDEFVVVATEGMERVEAVRRLVQALAGPIATPAGPQSISASIGVACAQPGDTADTLLRRADAAMFVVKRTAGAT